MTIPFQCHLNCPPVYAGKSMHCCLNCHRTYRPYFENGSDEIKARWTDETGFCVPGRGCGLSLTERPLRCAEYDCHSQFWLYFVLNIRGIEVCSVEESPLASTTESTCSDMGARLWERTCLELLPILVRNKGQWDDSFSMFVCLYRDGRWAGLAVKGITSEIDRAVFVRAAQILYRGLKGKGTS